MTSRERILAALDHREPDRVPIDCGAMRSTGIQAIAYARLKAHLGVSGGAVRVFDLIQQLAEPEDWYLDRFRIDAINAGRDFAATAWKDWELPDGTPCQVPAYLDIRRDGETDGPAGGGAGEKTAYCVRGSFYPTAWTAHGPGGIPVAQMLPDTTYFSQSHWPLDRPDWESRLPDLGAAMGEVCWAALPEPIYADGLSDANLPRIADHLRSLRQKQDRAVMIAYGANLFEWASYLRRMDHFLLDLAAEPAQAERLLDRLVEVHLAGLDRLLPAAGDYVDLIQLGDDLGMEAGPFFSPAMFRQMFKPRYRTIIERIKRTHPHIRVFLHCCGGVYPLIGDLIEAGVEVLNPVQIAAHGMDPARLKREFGKDLTFWGGGCDTQRVLSRGTPRQVRDHVRRNIEILAPGGGFVFNPVHNILSEVPPANILAMYEAAQEP